MRKILLFGITVFPSILFAQELSFNVSSLLINENGGAERTIASDAVNQITIQEAGVQVRELTAGTNYLDLAQSTDYIIINTASASSIRRIVLNYSANGGSTWVTPTVQYGGTLGSITSCATDQTGVTGTNRTDVVYNFPDGTKYIKVTRGVVSSCSPNGYSAATARIYGIKVGFSEFTLPLNFLSFTAKPHVSRKSVFLNWQTTNEINTKEFIIERRTDVLEFKAIDIKGSYNTNGVHNYSYTDNNIATGKVYYRLKQVDKDGMFEYSDIAVVDIKNGFGFSLYPNPTYDILNVEIGDEDTNELQVLNTNGQVVLSYKVVAGDSSKSFNMASLKPGTFFLQKVVNGSAKGTHKFIRQ